MSKFHSARTGFVVVTMTIAFASSAQAQTAQPNNSPPTRASEKADLKNLEAHGYKPAANESDYPNDIQRAEKATYGSGATGSASPNNATTPSTPQ
ncbi:DUF4148 domain-containing protein [Caballeronia sp. DA-9]|uniref:DUF4148 domain-containing protein n=1 Tax=Caballeronia sp. DA-9 TaxID=3436237 RepID=UPI003F67B942